MTLASCGPKGNVSVPQSNQGAKTNVNECLKGCAMLTGTGMFSKEFCTGSCWVAKAKDNNDASICEKDEVKKDGMLSMSCYLGLAESTGDAKYCDKIGDSAQDGMRGACYGTAAKTKKDPSVCEGIKGNMMYESCKEEAAGTEE